MSFDRADPSRSDLDLASLALRGAVLLSAAVSTSNLRFLDEVAVVDPFTLEGADFAPSGGTVALASLNIPLIKDLDL